MFDEKSQAIAPEIVLDPLLEIVSHLGAALIQADANDDPIIIGHLRSAHEFAIELRRKAAREAAMKEVDHATF